MIGKLHINVAASLVCGQAWNGTLLALSLGFFQSFQYVGHGLVRSVFKADTTQTQGFF